jgi:hypothetical protein
MELLQHIEGFIDSKIRVAKTFLLLIKLEAKLAGLSIFPLLLNLCMVFIILLTLWLTVMALLGMTIFAFIGNSVVALFLVLVVNLVLLFFLNHFIKENLRRMSFAKTRESLRRSDEHAINRSAE